MNEPFAGNIWADISYLLPEVADVMNLQPFYDLLSPYIRDIDPGRTVFFEGVTWSDLTMDGDFGLGFEHPPGGPEVGIGLGDCGVSFMPLARLVCKPICSFLSLLRPAEHLATQWTTRVSKPTSGGHS